MKSLKVIALAFGLAIVLASCSTNSTHTMEDGTHMDGSTHTEGDSHSMEDGTKMDGATHESMQGSGSQNKMPPQSQGHMDDGMESQ